MTINDVMTQMARKAAEKALREVLLPLTQKVSELRKVLEDLTAPQSEADTPPRRRR
jgi:hypothetical protein